MWRSVASMGRRGRVRKSVRPTSWPPPGFQNASGSGEGTSGSSLGPPPGLENWQLPLDEEEGQAADEPWHVREPLFCSPGPAFMAGWLQPGVPAHMRVPPGVTDVDNSAVTARRDQIHECLAGEVAKAVDLLADEEGGFESNGLGIEFRLELLGFSIALQLAFAHDVAWFGPLAEVGMNIGSVIERASAQEGQREALNPLTRSLRNVVLLACARGFAAEDMMNQGLPRLLNTRLTSVITSTFPNTAEEERQNMIANLGVAKHQLFCPGVSFGRRARGKKPS